MARLTKTIAVSRTGGEHRDVMFGVHLMLAALPIARREVIMPDSLGLPVLVSLFVLALFLFGPRGLFPRGPRGPF